MAGVITENLEADNQCTPSPKPRKTKTQKALKAASNSDLSVPIPKPRTVSNSRSADSMEVGDYINTPVEDLIRHDHHKSDGKTSIQSKVMTHNVLDLEGETDPDSSDVEGTEYISCEDYSRDSGKAQRYMNTEASARISREILEKLDAEHDSYVEMQPGGLSTILPNGVDLEEDNAYVRMHPKNPNELEEDDDSPSSWYQDPKSNKPVEVVVPKSFELGETVTTLHKIGGNHLYKLHTTNRIKPRLPSTPPPSKPPPELHRGNSPGSPKSNELLQSRAHTSPTHSPLRKEMRSTSLDYPSMAHRGPSSLWNKTGPRSPSPTSATRLMFSSVPGFHGKLSRDLSERRLAMSGVMVGDYLIRQSTSGQAESERKCVVSLKTTDQPMHVIIDYKDSKFWLTASKVQQISFRSLGDLVRHYQEHPIVIDGNKNKIKLRKHIPLSRKSST